MARKARVEFSGAVYHVLDRGDRREAIFQDEERDGGQAEFLDRKNSVGKRDRYAGGAGAQISPGFAGQNQGGDE